MLHNCNCSQHTHTRHCDIPPGSRLWNANANSVRIMTQKFEWPGPSLWNYFWFNYEQRKLHLQCRRLVVSTHILFYRLICGNSPPTSPKCAVLNNRSRPCVRTHFLHQQFMYFWCLGNNSSDSRTSILTLGQVRSLSCWVPSSSVESVMSNRLHA